MPMKKIQGFTLIEALVSLVVLSVGMIGIAALYAQGLGAGRTALFRTQAVNLAADMADRIRLNRTAQAAYAGAPANNSCGPAGGVNCTPAQMAADDLFVWNQQVQALLPNGQWQIQFNAATLPESYTIQLSWDDVGDPNPVTYQLTIQVPTI